MDEQNPETGNDDNASLSGETTVTEVIGEYANAVEVVYTCQNQRRVVLLRAFKVEESDLTTQSAILRRIEGKSLIAAPDGSTAFITHLSDVVSITVRPRVTVSYTYG